MDKKEQIIRGLQGNPLIIHPTEKLRTIARKPKGWNRVKYLKSNPLMTVIGYIDQGKVFVGVSVCSKNDAYCKKTGVKNAYTKLKESPLFIGTIVTDEKSQKLGNVLYRYLRSYCLTLEYKLQQHKSSISVIVGYKPSKKVVEKPKIDEKISEKTPETTSA